MFAIVGLGNPTEQYSQTRHNAGFWVIDALSDKVGSSSWKSKFNCDFQKVSFASSEVLLIKPQGYMNLSGETVKPLLSFFKIPPESIILVYDEVDLDVGVIQVRLGGSAGGHNGVADIIRHLGGDKFHRIRLGIGRPEVENKVKSEKEDDFSAIRGGKTQKISSWVLNRPGPKELELLDESVQKSIGALELLLKGGLSKESLEKAQQIYNRRQ